jgi:hypothetical protein
MKTATYTLLDGTTLEVTYDENTPCEKCGDPVVEASMGGTTICPWCDMGCCRYCGVQSSWMPERIDGGGSSRRWKEHMRWHHGEEAEVVGLEGPVKGVRVRGRYVGAGTSLTGRSGQNPRGKWASVEWRRSDDNRPG